MNNIHILFDQPIFTLFITFIGHQVPQLTKKKKKHNLCV